MNEQVYFDIITGRQRSLGASLARGGLRVLSWAYRGATGIRNAYHDFWPFPRWLDIPVISVGNLTVGGTGKTPVTLWICRHLQDRGLKPAVLSRGYKADAEGRADELMLIMRHCPQAVAVGNPDRWAAGQMAIADHGAQAAVLDDGLQHRRLGRDLEITLIDALEPWGLGYLLPRGLLRESPRGLRRADAVVISRCDQIEPEALEVLDKQIRAINPEIPVIRCVHEPTGFVTLQGETTTLAQDTRIGCFAGIARPEAFARTMIGQGHTPADTFWWPDHHSYTTRDIAELLAWVKDADLHALVTTEKDAVKLAALRIAWPVPVVALQIEIAFWGQGCKILGGLIDEVLQEYEHGPTPGTRSDAEPHSA